MSYDHDPGATYEGRPLARPAEELTDQGLSFDVATMLSRRNVLRSLGLGAVAVGLSACGGTNSGTTGSTSASGTASGSAALAEIPDETELMIKDPANDAAVFAGVAVYAWHCTRRLHISALVTDLHVLDQHIRATGPAHVPLNCGTRVGGSGCRLTRPAFRTSIG